MKNILILFVIIISCDVCNSQNFKYIKPSYTYNNFYSVDFGESNIIKYLPKNYVKDASVDYTRFIQKAIDDNSTVIFPNFPILISDIGLTLKNNSILYFNKNSALILKSSSNNQYSVFKIFNISNVKIYNPTLIGDRKTHKGKDGEWGMGIRIQSSKNIEIFNADIRDMWGDGIYVTSYNANFSDNIIIKHGIIDNVRRNGISIISGTNITVEEMLISNVNGTPPASAVDIEPNNTSDIIYDIKLLNINTFNNQRDGIILDFTKLVKSVKPSEIFVTVDGHKDVGSRYALRLAGLRNSKISDKNLVGKIIIGNCIWNNSRMKMPFKLGDNTYKLPDVELYNLKTNAMESGVFDKNIREIIRNRKQIKLR